MRRGADTLRAMAAEKVRKMRLVQLNECFGTFARRRALCLPEHSKAYMGVPLADFPPGS